MIRLEIAASSLKFLVNAYFVIKFHFRNFPTSHVQFSFTTRMIFHFSNSTEWSLPGTFVEIIMFTSPRPLKTAKKQFPASSIYVSVRFTCPWESNWVQRPLENSISATFFWISFGSLQTYRKNRNEVTWWSHLDVGSEWLVAKCLALEEWKKRLKFN